MALHEPGPIRFSPRRDWRDLLDRVEAREQRSWESLLARLGRGARPRERVSSEARRRDAPRIAGPRPRRPPLSGPELLRWAHQLAVARLPAARGAALAAQLATIQGLKAGATHPAWDPEGGGGGARTCECEPAAATISTPMSEAACGDTRPRAPCGLGESPAPAAEARGAVALRQESWRRGERPMGLAGLLGADSAFEGVFPSPADVCVPFAPPDPRVSTVVDVTARGAIGLDLRATGRMALGDDRFFLDPTPNAISEVLVGRGRRGTVSGCIFYLCSREALGWPFYSVLSYSRAAVAFFELIGLDDLRRVVELPGPTEWVLDGNRFVLFTDRLNWLPYGPDQDHGAIQICRDGQVTRVSSSELRGERVLPSILVHAYAWKQTVTKAPALLNNQLHSAGPEFFASPVGRTCPGE